MQIEDRKTYIREETICGHGPWVWLEEETGAWHGPSKEFPGIATMINKYKKGRSLIVQAGGCQGMYPRLWTDHFDRVVTFEPDPINFAVLEKNCAGYPVEAHRAALGDYNGDVYVQRRTAQNVGMNQITREEKSPIIVKQVKIDDLDLESCDAIQLDVETYEQYVLEGAVKTIQKFRPVITLEAMDAAVRFFMVGNGYDHVETHVSDHLWVPK